MRFKKYTKRLDVSEMRLGLLAMDFAMFELSVYSKKKMQSLVFYKYYVSLI